MKLIHPQKGHNKKLVCSSCLTLIITYFTYKNGNYIGVICSSSIFITSINHWRKPEYSLRRKIDIITVVSGLSIQSYLNRNHRNFYIYLFLLLIGTLFYPISIYVRNKCLASVCHCMIHVICNLASYFLCL